MSASETTSFAGLYFLAFVCDNDEAELAGTTPTLYVPNPITG